MRLKKTLDEILGTAVAVIMGLMVINVLWQVFTRFILNDPSSYTEELARFLLIWVGLLGAAYVSGQKMHLAIDMMSRKLQGRSKLILLIIIDILVMFFALTVMLLGGLRLSLITLEMNQISASLQIPLGYVYMVVPVSGAFIMYYMIFFTVENYVKLKGEN